MKTNNIRRLRKITAAASLIAIITVFSSCFDSSGNEYTVKVVCVGGSVSGFVIADDDGIDPYASSLIATDAYYYEVTYDDIENLYISATIIDGVDAYLTVFLYKNGEKVEEETLSVLDGTALRTITITYDANETDSETDTTTDEE